MRTSLKGLLFLAALLMAIGTAQAATITVDIGGACTLADAITAANTDTATGGCVAGAGDDTIILETDITLAAALPTITSTVIIEGGYHFISGNNNSSVGTVLKVASSGNLTLNQVIVTRGYNSTTGRGGGIYNDGGTIILTNSTVSGNSAFFSSSSSGGGGIYSSDGSITLTNSTVSGNSAFSFSPSSGGGICSYSSTITLNNSTVSGNSASSYPASFSSFSYGGGIFADNNSAVTLTKSTVSGNSASSSGLNASSSGGGIQSDGTITLNNSTVSGNSASSYPSSSLISASYGGGLNTGFGTITLTNSTVSGNSASVAFLFSEAYSEGGGINTYGGTITLINSTVSGNSAFSSNGSSKGGGIWNYANSGTVVLGNSTVILRSSLVSGNTASYSNEVEGPATIDSYNVLGNDDESSTQAFSRFTPSATDITATSDGTHPTALTAILSELANNGGSTKTHALPAGSPAIDLDTTCSTGLSTDQRGYPRPVGSGCDAGAYELGTVANKVNMAPIYKLLLFKRR